MTHYDLIIRNGTIVDGTGVPRFFGDVGVKDQRIARVSGAIHGSADREIDAAGKIVAPGVIDPHTHYDAQVHWDPYCTNSSWHGNTTVVVGNCGFGFAPCHPADRDRYMLMMENTEQVPLGAMREALSWDWVSFPEWMQHMRRLPKGVNLASYMPLNSLMIHVMGYEAAKSRGATKLERGRMRDLLHEAMDHGAVGFALSHLDQFNSHKDIDGSPMPTDAMKVEDAFDLAQVLRERDQGVIQCLCELPGAIANRATAEELARRSGRPVLHNVIAAFDALPDYHRGILRWLDEIEAQGLNIYSQAFSFRAWNEFNVVDFNAWQHIPLFNDFSNAGDAAAKARLAADPRFVARARAEYDPAQMAGAGGTLESFVLNSAAGASGYARDEGRAVGEIAAQSSRPASDVFFEIVAQSGAMADFRTTEATSADPQKIAEILGHKRTIPGTSDGGAHVKFHSGGQYATDTLMWMGRDEGLFSLEQLHFKLSYLPARIVGLEGRGALVEGAYADLYVYDLAELGYAHGRYEIANDLPRGDWRRVCRPQGIEAVVCNGVPIFEHGVATGLHPGQMATLAATDVRSRPPPAIAAE